MGRLTDEEIQKMVDKVNGRNGPTISHVKFAQFRAVAATAEEKLPLTGMGNIRINVSAKLGDAQLTVREVLDLHVGSVIELEKAAGEAVEILANDYLLALGEVVVINEVVGIRVNSMEVERDA